MTYVPTDNQPGQSPKKNSNVIYFLIVVVAALFGTDVYLYLQKNKSDVIVVSQSDEKSKLTAELDTLEAQIQQVNAGKTKLSVEMQAKKRFIAIKNKNVKIRTGQRHPN